MNALKEKALFCYKIKKLLNKCIFIHLQFSFIFSVFLVILKNLIKFENYFVGIDATVARYGFGLVAYSIFGFVFFITFCKNRYEVGKSFIPVSTIMMTARKSVPFSRS